MIILNLAWLDMTNPVVYVLLESIDLMKAIGNLEWYLGIADLIGMYTRQGIQLWVSIADWLIGKLCT